MVPLLFATTGVIKLGVCTISLLNVLIGSWTSVFLYKRRLLSLLNVCYAALQSSENSRTVLRLSDELLSELILIVALAPLAVTFLKAANASDVYASDASSWGLAVCKARLPSWIVGEVHRHKLRKNTWVKLLSPARALDRVHGELQTADELPGGDAFHAHPLHQLLVTGLQFEEVLREKSRDGLRINIGELQGMVRAEAESVFAGFPNRTMYLADSQVALGCWIKGRSSSSGLNQVLQQSLPIHLGCGMISNAGYVPTDVNVADDPTRGKSVRRPSRDLPEWLKEHSSLSTPERYCRLGEFLVSFCADPFELSGLPDFDELRSEDSLPLASSRVLRSKMFFAKNRAKKVSRNGRELRDVSTSRGSQEFCFPSTSLHEFSWPDEVANLLSQFDASQFIFPQAWKVPLDWRPVDSLPPMKGYLDLYSGKKGVARRIVEEGSVWALTVELEDGDNQDLSAQSLRTMIRRLIELEVFFAMGAAIFCRSFSRAVRPPIRSRASPRGLHGLTARMFKAVSEGNDHADWLAELISVACEHDLLYWVENPDGSFLWLLDAWIELGSKNPENLFRLDYCRCNCPWRKRTRFLTNCHLRGQSLFCLRDHKHRKLVGWSRIHKACWTRVAQTYPNIFCKWISLALLIDAGLRPDRKHINLASICGTIGRIGETSKPGPRYPRQSSRPVHLLDNATLIVEAGTELIGSRVWERFRAWCLRSLRVSTFEQLIVCPQTLVELLEAFGRDLFAEGASLYLYRHLLTAVQRWQPDFRPFMGRAWQLVVRWESLEPVRHRTPLPLVLFRAMVSIASLWGWRRFLGIMLLSYFGICRPGEPLGATRFDLLLPRDLVYEQPDVCFLCIRRPKSRRRGLGVASVVATLDSVFSGLQAGEPLYAGSPSSFRRRWDAILAALGVPKTLGLTPASMRSGGAITAYRADEDIVKILWRMRLKSLQTFSHYLQEVGALSVFGELPFDSRLRIERAAELYPVLLPGPSFPGGA